MNRRLTACSLLFLTCFVMLAALMPVSALAYETTLLTHVPSQHTLDIVLTGDGQIVVDGIACSASANLLIDRHSTPTVVAEAESGSKLKAAFLNAEDITAQLLNGTYMLPEMCSDIKLSVVFEVQMQTDSATFEIIPQKIKLLV